MGWMFMACCCGGGDYVWYQWNILGRTSSTQDYWERQDYIAMHLPVLPDCSSENLTLYESYAGDCALPSPPWRVQLWDDGREFGTQEHGQLWSNITAYQPMHIEQEGYYSGLDYERNFYCVDTREGGTPSVYVGMIDCSEERSVWQIACSSATDIVWSDPPPSWTHLQHLEFGNILPVRGWGNGCIDSQFGWPVIPSFRGGTFTTEFGERAYHTPFSPISSVSVGHLEECGQVAIGPESGEETLYAGLMAFPHVGRELSLAPYPPIATHLIDPGSWGAQYSPGFGYDAIVTYDEHGEHVQVGISAVQAWWEIEYPGYEILWLNKDWYEQDPSMGSNAVNACNAAEAAWRIQLIPPRTWPNCFAVKSPKLHLEYINWEPDDDNPFDVVNYDDDQTTVSVTESAALAVCSISAPEPEPNAEIREPVLATPITGKTIFEDEHTQTRVRLLSPMVGPFEPPNELATIWPVSIKITPTYGDINDEMHWGCIFAHSRRTVTVWEDTPDNWQEDITDETVRLKVRVNEEYDLRDWRCWRFSETRRAWDMIAAPLIEKAQNPGYPSDRHFMWLERNYSVEPDSESSGTFAGTKVFLHKVGSGTAEEIWRSDENPGFSNGHIRHCTDNLFVLCGFPQVWPESRGGDGEKWYDWICSYNRREVSEGVWEPVHYEPIRPRGGGEIFWTQWGLGPHVDSFKYHDANRIAWTW